MTSGIDPITGLDTAINDPYLYQIPLTTNPIQAPEWGWRGHVDQVLYPDHIPSIFATAQGYDESNPGAAQAHHMDGDGNLYVNVRKNEAGGGSKPTIWYGDAQDIDNTIFTYSLPTRISTIYTLTGSVLIYKLESPGTRWLNFILADTGGGAGFPLFRTFFPVAAKFAGYTPFPIPFTMVWPGGMDVSYAFDGSAQQAVFINAQECAVAITWGLVCS